MNKYFIEVTEELLNKTKLRFYGGGNELKIGDKLISGYTLLYANLYGIPPSKYRLSDVSLSLQLFVLNKKDNMIYQLYEKIKE
jgi:hypothetical protein